ncbi:hypothetical protein [Agrococcus sp. HG114]|uniref:hypothetical protein n=1 Tax=Agrococcus sp. HG114 TaxID=2969757 RepID=UPI00215AD967|nr:hypothetical protein [Agrococcus sp. HG114]MCR8670505.1 hypothetical protein [Agrococcus sp. HG114]
MASRFVPRWIVLVAAGEAIGFALATGAAVLAIVLELADLPRLALAVAGGAVEGAALGWGQWLAMQRNRPHRARWIGATSCAAALAWLLGMLPSTVGLRIDSAWTVALLAVGALALLASIPLAQWLVLDRPRTFRWVPVNMGAWLVAILWTAAPSPLVDEASPIWFVAVLYVAAGLLMALTVAALTAPVARALFGPDEPRRPPASAGGLLLSQHSARPEGLEPPTF